MSVLLLVGSEEQLSTGMAWCERICEAKRMQLSVAVVGNDLKILLKHTASRLKESDVDRSDAGVSSVADEPAEIVDQIKSLGARYVLMMKSPDSESWQQAVFEKSPVVTFWIQGSEPPPVDRKHVMCGLAETQLIATNSCEQLLGLIPGSLLIENPIVPPGEDSVQQHVDCAIDTIASHDFSAQDLICVGVVEPEKNNAAYAFGRKLFDAQIPATIALIGDGESIRESLSRSLADRIKNWVASVAPPMERAERQLLVENLEQGSQPNLEFLGLISASAMLAAFGLLQIQLQSSSEPC